MCLEGKDESAAFKEFGTECDVTSKIFCNIAGNTQAEAITVRISLLTLFVRRLKERRKEFICILLT